MVVGIWDGVFAPGYLFMFKIHFLRLLRFRSQKMGLEIVKHVFYK